MKTYRFPARPDAMGSITLPQEVMGALAPDSEIDVLVVVREDDEEEAEADRAWRRLGLEAFFKDYDESDSIYDDMR